MKRESKCYADSFVSKLTFPDFGTISMGSIEFRSCTGLSKR